MIGTSVSHYRIVEKLGSGGMGEVFVAKDERLGRQVAIKFPALREQAGESHRRFEREARAASRLTHPNIARIYDYGESADGRPFLVMELVQGTTLRDVLRKGRLEAPRVGAIIADVLRALAEAHSQGLVHRDIKPANVMLGPGDEVKVLDFGLAKQIPTTPPGEKLDPSDVETETATLTAPGRVAGTPAYMSPEQARGGVVDARSDLFSTGLLLYHCLTGMPPFSGTNTPELLNMVLTADPVPASARVPELSKRWDNVLAKALQKDPASRYQSAAEMLAEIEALDPARSRSITHSVQHTLVGTRRRAALTGLGALAVAVAAILLVRAGAPHQPTHDAEMWYERGAVALRDGTYYAATRMLKKAVDLDHDFALAHARLAEAATELDDSVLAANEMLAALPRGSGRVPPGIAGLYIDAIHRTLTGDFTGASKEYQQLSGKVGGAERAAVLVDLGRVYEKSNRLPEALAAYRDASSRDPQNAAAHLRASILMGRRRDPKYSEELDRAFSLYQTLSNTEGQAEVWYQRGYLLSVNGDLKGARAALEKSREMAQAIPSQQQEVAATLQLSIVDYLSGDLDGAEQMASEGVERAQRAGMNYLAARGLANLGEAQFVKRDWARAASSYGQSLEVARRFHMRRAEARALFGLANVHQTAGPIESASDEAAAAMAYFKQAGFRLEAVQCLTVLGRVHRDLGRGDEAAHEFDQALAGAKEISSAPFVLRAEQGLASVLLYYGRWPEAVGQYIEARQAAAALDDTDDVVRALTGQAAALWRLGRYEEAGKTLAEADRAVEKANSRASLEPSILYRKAEMALSRGLNAEAAAIAQRMFESKSASPQSAQSARCMAGVAMARSGRAAAGRLLCEPALAPLEEAGDRFAIADALLAQAEILLAQGEDASALASIEKVIDAAEQVKIPETEWQAWALRARSLRHQGDKDGAGQASQKASERLAALGWDAASLQGYLSRPDIASLHKEIQGGAQ